MSCNDDIDTWPPQVDDVWEINARPGDEIRKTKTYKILSLDGSSRMYKCMRIADRTIHYYAFDKDSGWRLVDRKIKLETRQELIQ